MRLTVRIFAARHRQRERLQRLASRVDSIGLRATNHLTRSAIVVEHDKARKFV